MFSKNTWKEGIKMIKKKNIVIGLTALALVLSPSAIAFAATSTTNDQTEKVRSNIMSDLTDIQREAVQQVRASSMTESMKELVDNGTITQAEADKLPKNKIHKKEANGLPDLSDEQRTVLRSEEKTLFESQLAVLIKDGTITQAQVDQMKQGHKMMQSANFTEEQRTSVMEAKTNATKQAAANLVENGILTQDEADVISAMWPPQKEDSNGPENILTEEQKTILGDAIKAKIESKLAALVQDGTLTQTQADQLLSSKDGLHIGGRHGHDPGDI